MRERGCPGPKMNEEKKSIEPDPAMEGTLVLNKRNTGGLFLTRNHIGHRSYILHHNISNIFHGHGSGILGLVSDPSSWPSRGSMEAGDQKNPGLIVGLAHS